jgi:hypothetical protein
MKLKGTEPITVAARSKASTVSLARTLGSCLQIQPKAWISVCVFILCVGSGYVMSKESYWLCKKKNTKLKKRQGHNKGL